MTRIGASCFAIAQSYKRQATFRLLGDLAEEHFNGSSPRAIRLFKIAHREVGLVLEGRENYFTLGSNVCTLRLNK